MSFWRCMLYRHRYLLSIALINTHDTLYKKDRYNFKTWLCLLLKHNTGHCIVNLDGFDHIDTCSGSVYVLSCFWVLEHLFSCESRVEMVVNLIISCFAKLLGKRRTPSINAQCRSMPIKIPALIPMSINSDQCWSIPIDSSHCRSMPINVLLMPWSGIDRQWSAFRDISDQCHDFDRHWSALGIDRGSPVNDEKDDSQCILTPHLG